MRRYSCREPPPHGFLKLNIDGALFFHNHKAGLGIILINEDKETLMVVNKVEHRVNSLDDIGLLAIFRVLHICSSTELTSSFLKVTTYS